MGQTHHSPALALSYFWLFPNLKDAMKGQRFGYISDIQCNMTVLLRGITENDFQDY
jgi:hypothetical protein